MTIRYLEIYCIKKEFTLKNIINCSHYTNYNFVLSQQSKHPTNSSRDFCFKAFYFYTPDSQGIV